MPREEVARNQRTRIFGAVVASVAELGYRETGVKQISEISGVSTRSLYDLFPGGKAECFLVVLDQILKGTLATLSSAGQEEDDWERRLTAIYMRFAQMVSDQPAAAMLVLGESYAAGPEARKVVEAAIASFERLPRRRIAESPERAGIPGELVSAQVGALQELARSRLHDGKAETLPALVPELVQLVAGYRPPPERLRLGNRRPTALADGISSAEEDERAIRGLIMAVAEHGYEGATLRRIAQSGLMSLDTFYANFPDKRAVLFAALDSSTAQMQAIAMSAYRRSPGWASGVRAAIGGALGFLAARPATATLLLSEVYAGGPEAVGVRAAGLRELLGILEERAHELPTVPAVAPEAILAGILTLARRQLLRKGAESLPSLAPVATYLALAPYIGADEACRIANGDARPGNHPAEATRNAETENATALKWVLCGMLGRRWATAEELADEFGAATTEVEVALAELAELGLIEQLTRPDGTPEWTNVKRARVFELDEWATIPVPERHEMIVDAARRASSDLDQITRREPEGVRLDEHYTRIVLEVDEQGWKELSAIHLSAFHATETVRANSERRMRRSGATAIRGRSLQLLVEIENPDEDNS